MTDEILTLNEALKLLKISKPTLTKYFKLGLIPGRKVGQQYRFSRNDLINWVSNGSHSPTTK